MEYLKLLTGELCYALLGNINDNIDSVSFNIKEKDNIHIQFILKIKSEKELVLIDDTLIEFEAIHGSLKAMKWSVFLTSETKPLLPNIVYSSYKMQQQNLSMKPTF